jgi:allantoinase
VDAPERFALSSRRVLTPAGLRPAAVLVDGERIVAVVEPTAIPGRFPVRDLADRVLFPGLGDCHVHLNDPGRAEWEGFETGTRAAAAGGVTTLVDMPLNCVPVTTCPSALETKVAAAQGRLWVDCGLWGGLVPGNADQVGALIAAGALGIKAFLIDSGLAEFPAAAEADLRAAMPRLAELGAPLLVHAELDCGAPTGGDPGPPRSYRRYLHSRPAAWEEAAIELLIGLARETGCATHIVHLSAASAVPALRRARAAGLPVSVETCPHYLGLAAEEVPDGDTRFKCAPPIRDAANREALWRALDEGVIDFVVSDHSPCTPALKQIESGDFERAWGGIASLQLGLPALWTQARRRGFGLEPLARWMCAEPARFAGLEGRKGAIAPGHDADFVAWDPDARFDAVPEALHQRHPLTPYLGRELDGVVETTWLRGRVVFDRGDFHAVPRGSLLRGRTQASRPRSSSARGPR